MALIPQIQPSDGFKDMFDRLQEVIFKTNGLVLSYTQIEKNNNESMKKIDDFLENTTSELEMNNYLNTLYNSQEEL